MTREFLSWEWHEGGGYWSSITPLGVVTVEEDMINDETPCAVAQILITAKTDMGAMECVQRVMDAIKETGTKFPFGE
jgi:hypothetical protein